MKALDLQVPFFCRFGVVSYWLAYVLFGAFSS
jgi:hypothetical protein